MDYDGRPAGTSSTGYLEAGTPVKIFSSGSCEFYQGKPWRLGGGDWKPRPFSLHLAAGRLTSQDCKLIGSHVNEGAGALGPSAMQ